MYRFAEQEARLKRLRQVEKRLFRESQNLIPYPISFPCWSPSGAATSMTTTMRTTFHTITPTRDCTNSASTYSPLTEFVTPVQTPLKTLSPNRRGSPHPEADGSSKKNPIRYMAPEHDAYHHDQWPSHHHLPPPLQQTHDEPSETEVPCYPRGDASFHETRIHYREEESTFTGGYLEDDFRIPPPPHFSFGYDLHPSYEGYPAPPRGFNGYYYEPPRCPPPAEEPPQDSCSLHQPMQATHEERDVVSQCLDRKSPSPGELREMDIVCGRGAPTNFHYGNQAFKDLVEEYQTSYLCAKRCDKPQMAMKIMDIVKERGARFVRREKASGGSIWVEIDPKGAYEKVCQALRQGAPEIRRKSLSSAVGTRK